MPWKETCAVSERHHLVELVREGIGVSEAARTLGISRKTAYKWLSRHDLGGVAGLADRSRARHTQEHATPVWLRETLVDLRLRTGSGPRQLLFLIGRRMPEVRLPSVSTVSSILRKAGLVEGKRSRRRDAELRGPTGPYRAGTAPNEQWTVDFKGHFRLGDRSVCHPLTVQDDASRYLLCVDGHGSTSTAAVLSSFVRLFRRRGLPERIHSDNGSPFAGTGIGRLSQVNVEWMRQGIEVCRSRVGHPEDNPRHERMHRTLKSATARPPCRTAEEQQRRFGGFMRWMNEDRGHEALGMRCPGEVYRASPREWRSKPPEPEYPGHWEVRRIRRTGEVKLAGRTCFISTALSGEAVGLEEILDGIWRLTYRRSSLCFLDLRSGTLRVMGEPEAEDLVDEVEE
jgi:transposase InsO family protein